MPDQVRFTRLDQPTRAWAAASPDAPAVREGDRRLSYLGFATAIDEAADALRSLSVRAGDRVMLVGENGIALGAFILAAARLDACAVLENARRAPREVDGIRDHCAPRRVVYLVGNSPDAAAHAARHGAVERSSPLLGRFAHSPHADEVETDAVTGTADDTAVLIYTTGTTGRPKGVMLSHGNLLYLAGMMGELRRMTPADRVYGVLPITHVMGLAGLFGGTLRAGAEVHLVPRFEVAHCAAALQHDGVTMLQGAPAMFAKLADFARSHPFSAPALRFIAAGGAPIDEAVKADTERLFGLVLHNGYGLTEGSGLAWTRLDQPRGDCSVGLPLPGVEMQLLAPGGGEPVAAGEVGELWARGPNVMKGYYRDPARTAEAMREGGWFNTQDLARIAADGHVTIEGRTKDLIISSGFNVYPLEVETALNAHPAIVQSAVLGHGEGSREEVVAFVELAQGDTGTLDRAALNAFLGDRLSPYKRPRAVWVLPALPASPNGKVLKSRLKDLLESGAAEPAARRLN